MVTFTIMKKIIFLIPKLTITLFLIETKVRPHCLKLFRFWP